MDGAQYHICVLATVISHYIPMKNNRSQTVPIRVVRTMVLVLGGITQNMLRTHENRSFLRNNPICNCS